METNLRAILNRRFKSGRQKKRILFIPDVSIKTELFRGAFESPGKTIHRGGESDILFYKKRKNKQYIRVLFVLFRQLHSEPRSDGTIT